MTEFLIGLNVGFAAGVIAGAVGVVGILWYTARNPDWWIVDR